MSELSKPMRALLGLVAIALLFFVVLGFWNQFRSASRRVAVVESPARGASINASSTPKSAKTSSAKTTKAAEQPASGQKFVVIQIQGLNFRETPAPDANPIRGLDAGEKLILVAKEGNWYKVRDAQGIEGYVSANDQYTRLETAK